MGNGGFPEPVHSFLSPSPEEFTFRIKYVNPRVSDIGNVYVRFHVERVQDVDLILIVNHYLRGVTELSFSCSTPTPLRY